MSKCHLFEVAWELEKVLIYHSISAHPHRLLNQEGVMARRGLEPISRKVASPHLSDLTEMCAGENPGPEQGRLRGLPRLPARGERHLQPGDARHRLLCRGYRGQEEAGNIPLSLIGSLPHYF